jgi:two-component system chemotaxis sensor kinase CheA
LRAFHRGGSIYIEIQDDGRGLDRDAILQKAVRMRLVREGATLSEREVFNLITVPGFSTAERVTEISGRGVGMDVVRRNVEALRGQIEISSVRGKGTTFSMRLPITLAIIDGMIVKVGSERYIMPTLSLVRTVKPDPTDLHHVLSRCRILQEGGSVLPVVALADQLGLERSDQALTDGLILIVEAENRRVGILVDALLGKQQTVIKSLGGLLRNTPGVSGGAIMPDGNVSLILDVDGLVRMATRAGDPAAQAA